MKLRKGYMATYNLALSLAWCEVVRRTIVFPLDGVASSTTTKKNAGATMMVYENVAPILLWAQTAAGMEIVHAFFGFVRSSTTLTFYQVGSRFLILWGVLWGLPGSRKANVKLFGEALLWFELNCQSLCLCWGCTEVVRYSYYFCKTVGVKPPKPLEWLRYTLFIVLYPLGVASEVTVAFEGLAPLARKGKLDFLKMPNAMNVSLHGWTLMACALGVWLMALGVLYTHMFKLRKKVLRKKKAHYNSKI